MGKSKYVAADKHGVLYNLKRRRAEPWPVGRATDRSARLLVTAHACTHARRRTVRARAGGRGRDQGDQGAGGRCGCNNRDDVALVHVRVRDQLLLRARSRSRPVGGGEPGMRDGWERRRDEGWMDGSVGLSGVPASCVPVGRGERTATVRTLMLRRMCVSRFRVAQRRCIVQQTSD